MAKKQAVNGERGRWSAKAKQEAVEPALRRAGGSLVVTALVGATLCSMDRKPDPETAAAAAGYVLFSPLLSGATHLVDKEGRVVHTWESDFAPGASVYLLDNGHLLRPARDPDLPFFTGGGQGGRIQEYTWEGRLRWDFVLGSRDRMPHHDIAPLPNVHVLAIVWERKSQEEAIRAGRRPELVSRGGAVARRINKLYICVLIDFFLLAGGFLIGIDLSRVILFPKFLDFGV